MAFLKYLSSSASLAVQIILVIAAVVLFSYYDPFGMLAPSKKTIENTPVQVESIRQIGQLITAEYYGEVIASIDEVLSQELQERIDTFNVQIDQIHQAYLDLVDSLVVKDLSRRKIRRLIQAEMPYWGKTELEQQYAFYLQKRIRNRNYKERHLDKKLSQDEFIQLTAELAADLKLRNELNNISTDELQTQFRKEGEHVNQKKSKNRKLVILGRGSVKAGFNFESFNERNFLYDNRHKRIIFIGLQPQIISATINPWFIPEEGVEGFEFLVVERGVKNDLAWTNQVKQLCLDKLILQATSKQILDKAQANAEFHLQELFSLFAGEQIKSIAFFTDYLDYSADALLTDSVLRDDEIAAVDTILIEYDRRYHGEFSAEAVQQFIEKLDGAKKQLKQSNFSLNSFSGRLFQIFKDQMIDSLEMAQIANWEKQPTKIDTLFYGQLSRNGDFELDSALWKEAFNEFMDDRKKIEASISARDSLYARNKEVLETINVAKPN